MSIYTWLSNGISNYSEVDWLILMGLVHAERLGNCIHFTLVFFVEMFFKIV